MQTSTDAVPQNLDDARVALADLSARRAKKRNRFEHTQKIHRCLIDATNLGHVGRDTFDIVKELLQEEQTELEELDAAVGAAQDLVEQLAGNAEERARETTESLDELSCLNEPVVVLGSVADGPSPLL